MMNNTGINNTTSFPGGIADFGRILEKRRISIETWIKENNFKTLDEVKNYIINESCYATESFLNTCTELLNALVVPSQITVEPLADASTDPSADATIDLSVADQDPNSRKFKKTKNPV